MIESLSKYSVDIPDAEYHLHPAWSYSQISRYAREGFSAIQEIHNPTTATPSMEFGSLVDALLTQEGAVEDMYIVSDTVPPPAEKAVLDLLLTKDSRNFDSLPESVIEGAMTECSYRGNLKFETRLSKLAEHKSYFDIRQSGKKVVSSADWNDALDMKKAIRENEYLSSLFGTENTDGAEYLYQMKLFFDVPITVDNKKQIVHMKAMLDLVKIDHDNKTVQPIDLKTSAQPAYNFSESFVKYRYDIQASVYSRALKILMANTKGYEDYKLLPYLFVDISREDKVPVTYVYDPFNTEDADGFTFKDYKYKDWRTLLAEILTYEETEAQVPSYIKLNEPNDIKALLNQKN